MSSPALQSDPLDVQVLVDSIPALIHTARPDGYLDYFNKPWLEYLGVTLDQVAGWNWTNFIHPEDLDGILGAWRHSLATGNTFQYETRVRKADGSYRWMFHRKVALRSANGAIVKWYGSSLDIDESKTAEEHLRRKSRELQRNEFYLSEGQRLAHMGSWVLESNGSFSYWSDELFRIFGMDSDADALSFEGYLARVHPEDRESVDSQIKRMIAEKCPCDSTKRVVRPDGETRYIRCVGIPIVEHETLHGFLGTAIDVTEHEQLTQELRLREAYLAEAQTLSQTGSFGWKVDTGEVVWSDETYRIFEFDRSDTPTVTSVLERIHPEDRADSQRIIAEALSTAKNFEHTFRLLMPDGRIKHVHAMHALRDAFGARQFVGAVTDITARKDSEETVRRSEAYLSEAQRLTHTGSWAWTPLDRSAVHLSEEWFRIFGFDRAHGAPTWEQRLARVHPDDRLQWKSTLDRALENKTDYEVIFRIVLPEGTIRWIHTVGHPVLDEGGSLLQFIGSSSDITDQKEADQKLQEQEVELRQIIDLAPQIIGVFGPDWERLYVNRMCLEYLGLTLEEWQKNGLLDEIHPDDVERLNSSLVPATSQGSPNELEVRLRMASGNYRWFLAQYSPVLDDKGQIRRWYVMCTDIEDRKNAEERLRHENVALREEIDKTSMFEEIVGTSRALKSVLSHVSKVAPSDSTVLITGETGTGKELVARAIHRRSDRASGPFVGVNCAAIPRDLISSELFGHEKGAFTGATQQRPGRFELANGGTIFLDEVGELPGETQIALLRVLQEHEFERVGGNRQIRADVRVIAATNRDLQAAISGGSFRSDLFYRLHVFPIDIPPLRQRAEDIPLLMEYFVDRYARKAGKKIKSISKKTLQLLQDYPWPGNIRELQNVIERSVILCETETFSIDEHWLPRQTPLTADAKQQVELPRRLMAQEKNMIEAALKDTRGRVSGPRGAAAKLGIPRSTLESKIRSLKINKNRFRTGPGS